MVVFTCIHQAHFEICFRLNDNSLPQFPIFLMAFFHMKLHWHYNREFDEGLLQRIPEISYEDDMKDIPSAPDVSNYLVSEVSFKCFDSIRWLELINLHMVLVHHNGICCICLII